MENFEPLYHVPQQSRRDKLRVQLQSNSSTNLVLPFNYHEDKTLNYVLMDPQSSIIPFQEITSNPFLYSHQRFLEQPFDNNNNIITTCQGLSLSLSSHNYNNTNYQISSNSHVPLGPFTGYALILKGSRFLKPAQMLLEEICHDEDIKGIYGEKLEGDDDLEMMDPSLEATISDDGSEHRRKKSKLIYMLDEVCKRYKQYYQQLQAVVASFESVPGLGNAAPFANLSLKALSKHFKGLKNSITDQLQYTGKSQNCESDSIPRVGTYPGKGHFGQKSAIHNAGFVDHHQPVWRPQRGLPERAVTVLRAWLFDHFLHPYPTDSDKVMLAKQTGLSRNQVSNWFINARVRLWKPMVEEIHMLETKQAHKTSSQRDQVQNNNPSLASENPSTSTQQFQDVSFKRTRNNNHPTDQTQGMNFSRPSRVETSGTTGVSLTLGLHQNNNNGLGSSSDQSFPRNAARRFGIDANNEGFMFGNFDQQAQNRQLAGREIIGGQMLHDFVG